MTTWYEVRRWHSDISPVEVISSTDKTILVPSRNYIGDVTGERRCAIASTYSQFFRTYEEAYEFLCSRLERQIEQAKETVRLKESELAKLRAKAR